VDFLRGVTIRRGGNTPAEPTTALAVVNQQGTFMRVLINNFLSAAAQVAFLQRLIRAGGHTSAELLVYNIQLEHAQQSLDFHRDELGFAGGRTSTQLFFAHLN
jgi:hypothetical protein